MAQEAPVRSREVLADPPEDTPNTIWTRRDFFTAAGWGAVLVYLGTVLLAFTRFMFPRVLFEPNPVFDAGAPESYLVGIVDERFKNEKRVWIVRTPEGKLIVDKSAIYRMAPGVPPTVQYPQSILKA